MNYFENSLSFEYNRAYNYLNNTWLVRFIGVGVPMISNESVVETSGVYRIPGLKHPIICDYLFLMRFMSLVEIWDSSQVFTKMFSLILAPIFQFGLMKNFDNYEGFRARYSKWNMFGNIGIMLVLDILGTISFFVSITFDHNKKPCFDFGVIINNNTFTKEKLALEMA